MSSFTDALRRDFRAVEAEISSLFSPAPVAPATATQPESQETNHMATTATTASVTLGLLFAGQTTPTEIVIDPNTITLPVPASITITASSPPGALVETITATGEIAGYTLPSIPLTSFPINLTGALGFLEDIVKAADATITLTVVAA